MSFEINCTGKDIYIYIYVLFFLERGFHQKGVLFSCTRLCERVLINCV